MKIFYSAPNPHANGTGLNFKSNLRPAALISFTRRENFKNFVAHEQAARATNREAVSARRAGSVCRDAKTVRTTPIDAAASENISNFAAHKRCADRKNFKIFSSGKIKFATHGELKFTMRGMVKFMACSWLKFEPRSTATRGFALCDRILNPRLLKSCTSFKVSSRRGEKAK